MFKTTFALLQYVKSLGVQFIFFVFKGRQAFCFLLLGTTSNQINFSLKINSTFVKIQVVIQNATLIDMMADDDLIYLLGLFK